METFKLLLNISTVIAWAMGIIISALAVTKGRRMKDEMGVSYKTYLGLVATTEIFYTIGAIMILSAMGIHVMQHLFSLQIKKFFQAISQFELYNIQIVGFIGWSGFIINRSVSFLSPTYLLTRGGGKLPRYFFYSAISEVVLEVATTLLVFFVLWYR